MATIQDANSCLSLSKSKSVKECALDKGIPIKTGLLYSPRNQVSKWIEEQQKVKQQQVLIDSLDGGDEDNASSGYLMWVLIGIGVLMILIILFFVYKK